MITLEAVRTEMHGEILRIAAHHDARQVRVLGSVGKRQTLVISTYWSIGRWTKLLDHARLVQDLESLLGIKVHVGTEKSLH